MSELELELEPLAAPAYIGSVRLGGVDGVWVDLANVLASVAIRHGRDDVDGPIQASTATLRLRAIPRADLELWAPGTSLEVRDTDGDPIFTGRITDNGLLDDDPRVDSRLEVIAVSPLADAGRRPVGGHQWPAELWGARMARILSEANLTGIVQAPTPDVPLAATVPIDPLDPTSFETMDALAALETDRSSIGATAFDQADGRIVVQAYAARAGVYTPVRLDPVDVLYSPPWSRNLDVVNRVVLGYGYGAGSITVDDPASQAIHGVRWSGSFETGLADAATATSIANLWLSRLSEPRWKLPSLTLLKRYPLKVGLVLELLNLPATAPLGQWTPIVEGWTDIIEGPDWHQEVVLSDPLLSGLALPWRDVPAGFRWLDVDPACSWSEAFVLDNLIPG